VTKVQGEERGEVGALVDDRPVGVDGADQLLHGVRREVEHPGCLGDEDLEVGEGVMRRAGQLQVESPAEQVGPAADRNAAAWRSRLVFLARCLPQGDQLLGDVG
jgi:hypothetical protein